VNRLILIFLFLISNILICFAQEAHFGWAKKIGGTGDERGNDLTIDQASNVLITGSFTGSADFDPSPGNSIQVSKGMDDIFIEKLDSRGDLIWTRTIGGTVGDDRGESIKADAAGNVYVTGTFTGKVDFNPGPESFEITGKTPVDNFIVKLNSAGDFLWAKSFGDISGNAIVIDKSGNIFSMGYSLRKISSDGDLLWSFRPSGGIVEGHHVEVDVMDNVYVAGRFSGTVDFDPSSSALNLKSISPVGSGLFNDNDAFVAKFDNAGNLLWVKQVGGANRDEVYGLAVDDFMNVYATGVYYLTGDFNPSSETYELVGEGQSDCFILKLNASGDFEWAKKIGSSEFEIGESIQIDAHGNAYVTGSFNKTIELAPGLILTSTGGPDQFILTLDFSGNFLWAKGISGGEYMSGTSIALGSTGNVYTAGTFYGTTQFDFESETTALSSSGQGDVYFSSLSVFDMPTKQTNNVPSIKAYLGNATINDNALILQPADFEIDDLDNTSPSDFTLTILVGENYTVSGLTITPALGYNGLLTISVKVNDGKADSNLFQFTITINQTITSTEENIENKFEIYPNPSSEFVFVKNPLKGTSITIYNMCGEVILNEGLTSNQINISSFARGIYIVRLFNRNGDVSIHKLLVN
jgi:hypothetical protein